MGDKTEVYSLLRKYHMPQFVQEYQDVERIPTGSLILDYAFGGGLPRGRCMEIGGLKSFGKTTTALAIAAAVAEDGGRVAYIDTEGSLDWRWAEALGVENANFFLFQREGETLRTMEDSLQLVRDLVTRNTEFKFDVIMYDSIAAAAPRAMMEGTMDDNTFALRARLNEQFFSVIPGDLRASRACLLMLNQGRVDPGSRAHDKTIFPGGEARKHAHVIMCKMLTPEPIKVKGEDAPVGFKFRGYTTKNKTAPPGRAFEVSLRYDPYVHIDRITDLVDAGKLVGVFKNREGQPHAGNATWFFNSEEIGRSLAEVKETLQDQIGLCSAIESEIRVQFDQMKGQIQKPEAVLEED